MVGVVRLFVAVEIPDETRSLLAATLSEYRLPGRLVAPESWHLTLRFLGDTDEVGFDRVCAELDQARLGRSFRLGLGGLGAFPRPDNATVLWIGLNGDVGALIDLAGVVEDAVEEAGFTPEDRPFRPHLTLSRLRPQQEVSGLLAEFPPTGIRFKASDVVVYRSHLGAGPVRYEALERFRLDRV